VLFSAGNLLLSGAFVLQPLVVRFGLAPSWTAMGMTYATALALITSALSAGGVVGGAVVSATGGLKSGRMAGVVAGFIAQGIALAIFGLSPQLYLSAASTFAIGLLSPFVQSHSQAIWQTLTPTALQGRVFAVRRAAVQALSPIGIALGGALSAAVAAGPVVAGAGVLLVLFGSTQAFNRTLMRASA
jgi:DHA3 family macrolide efflux protein-like MFS transporter